MRVHEEILLVMNPEEQQQKPNDGIDVMRCHYYHEIGEAPFPSLSPRVPSHYTHAISFTRRPDI